jgi:hypothetical protein
MFPESGWKVGGEEKRLGRKLASVRDGRGREKRWGVKWFLPPEEVRVRRNRRPVEVVAMYVWGWENGTELAN